MSTKEKIIACAISYFNREGLMSASMRGIAKACGITLSNLQYYFATKDKLVETIFDEMGLVYEGMADFAKSGISLQLLLDMNSIQFEFQKKYIFYFTQLNAILQAFPGVRKKYLRMKTKRVKEYLDLFNAYSKAGLFIPEPYEGFFRNQAELLWFMGNYYLSSQLCEGKKANRKTFDESNKVAADVIYKMLSEKGIFEMMKLIKDKGIVF